MSICEFPNCKIFVRDGRHCPGHQKMMPKASAGEAKPAPKEKKPAKKAKVGKRSKKMKKEIAKLKPIIAEFLSRPGNNLCAINSPVCTKAATCVNHTAGRTGKKLTDTKYFEPSCTPCNGFIEENDAWAREHGHKISRLSPNENLITS